MSVIGSNILAGASGQGGGYNLDKSLRFRSSASAYLSRTPASAGNRKTYSFSTWVKRGKLGIGSVLGLGAAGAVQFRLYFDTDDTLRFFSYSGAFQFQLKTTQVFRDTSAWYHIVFAIDTTQATDTNRVKLYVNGVQVTSFSTATYPTQNTDLNWNQGSVAHGIGAMYDSGTGFWVDFLDGYQTEVNFIDGQALTPSSFGQTSSSTGVWQPKKYTGTYGTNGFYLPFNVTVETYNIDYLVVAGGGGGAAGRSGGTSGGGGGAGGYRAVTGLSITPTTTYAITVGGGGAGGTDTSNGGGASQGSTSSAFSTSTTGGGKGGGANSEAGGSGGSGGGGAASGYAPWAGGAGTGNAGGYSPVEGYNGGAGGSSSPWAGNGGGSGGAANGNAVDGAGVGTTWLDGNTYAGGGGGAGPSGKVGKAGGGTGGTGTGGAGTSATANSGSGGGGGSDAGVGGSGGSGIVIIRYAGSQKGTGGTVTSSGGYTYHTFTSSGTFTA